jgi:HEAT repeat protein
MNAQSSLNDTRADEEIVSAALTTSCEEDSDEYWSAIRILQNRMTVPLVQRMRKLILQGSERQRQLAADVIAQGRAKNKEFSGECVQLLLDALKREDSSKVLSAICNALGHHKAENAIDALTKLQGHPAANVRLAVVHGLSCQDEPAAINSLISLSTDSDRDVRNWATFGLGSMTEADSIPLREALLARITEDDEEISGEALVGLALRADTRIAGPLLTAINKIHEVHREFGFLIVEAVEAVRVAALKHPNEAWLPILARCDELSLGKSAK